MGFIAVGTALLVLLSTGSARAVVVHVGFEGVVGNASGSLTGAQSFSGAIVYSTDSPSCSRLDFGDACVIDDGSGGLTVQLDGAGPIYANDPADPVLEILLFQGIVDRVDPDEQVPPDDPNGVLREIFAPHIVGGADVGGGDYSLGLSIDRLFTEPPFLFLPDGPNLLDPSSKLAAELVGGAFSLEIASGPGEGSVYGTVTNAFVIPEPVTACLLLAGLMGLALAGRPGAAKR